MYPTSAEIATERDAQDRKWGEQNHPAVYWLAILTEEVGELAKEVIAPTDSYNRRALTEKGREELIQVAAVAHAWLDADWRAKGRA